MDKSFESKVMALWGDLCREVADLQRDIEKNTVKHNVSAGVRVRKGLRDIRKHAAALLKESLDADKSVVGDRKAKNADKPKKAAK